MTLTVQLQTILSMAAAGIYLGAAIDTYRRFSKRTHSFHWLVAFNDLLFWLIQALIVFYVLLKTNNGEVRFYIFLALLCGFAAYQALFQSLYKKLLEMIITLSIRTSRIVRNIISVLFVQPIKFILKLIYSLCMIVITTILTALSIALKPFQWFGTLLLKWTGLEKIPSVFQKWKDFFRSIWKRKE